MKYLFQIVLALRCAYTALALLLVTLLLLPFQLVSIWLDLPLQKKIPQIWHRVIAIVLRLDIKLVGKVSPNRPLLLVSNHQSWIDIVVLGALMPISFIAKAEVRGWAGFGWLARLQRSVFVNRDRRSQTVNTANEISQRMLGGDVMVLFAEGTTSDGNRILPYRTALFGAVQLAEREAEIESVAVQTAVISYVRIRGGATGRADRKALSWYGDAELLPHIAHVLSLGPVSAEVHLGDQLELTGKTDRKELARACQQEAVENFARANGFSSS